MNDWTAGYVTDVDYTFGYYAELNPLRSRLALLNSGIKVPTIKVACELGFGQGLSTNIHAATSSNQWYGTDFNPSQAAFAQELANLSGNDAHLFDQSFLEFASRVDLPEFDYIGLHGIWSWISDENRQVIVDFIRRKLKVGGILYISYNTEPGWAAFMPMRNLLKEHVKVNSTLEDGIIRKVEKALDFASELLATKPKFLDAIPGSVERIEALRKQNTQYLAHEYFNQDWHPLLFSTTSDLLKPAKMSYACSAHYLDHVDTINLTSEQQKFLGQFKDRNFKETIRDYMGNRAFRRDLWIKGPRSLPVGERVELLKKECVVLIRPRITITLKVTGYLGSADMSEELYNPVLDYLADYQVRTLDEIFKAVTREGYEFGTFIEVIMVLAGAGHIASTQESEEVSKVLEKSKKLNQHLLVCDGFDGQIAALACPLTGGGIAVTRFQKMFIVARSQGMKSPQEWAVFAFEQLAKEGKSLVVEGKVLESREENISELKKNAKIFEQQELPMLEALLVI